jgi:protoporphyrinogen oxidase
MGVPADAAEVESLIGTEAAERLAAEQLTPPIAADDVSLGVFLSERLGDAIVDSLVDPLLGGVYAGRCRDLSLAETVPSAAARRSRRHLGARPRGQVSSPHSDAQAAESGQGRRNRCS